MRKADLPIRYNWSARCWRYIMSEERLDEIEVDLEDDLYDKIVKHLGTDEPEVVQEWVSEVILTLITEYLDKEMQ